MYDFFAYMSRMKYIKRWSLMRSTEEENIMEHSLQVSMIAHSLSVIKNLYFGGKLNPDRIAVLAMYHESSEVITGDLPTPIKYSNPTISAAYKHLEKLADDKLLSMLPSEMKDYYQDIIKPNPEEYKIVKMADKISAYLKCLDELKSGNKEFLKARDSQLRDIEANITEEARYFLDNFAPSFDKTLDELN